MAAPVVEAPLAPEPHERKLSGAALLANEQRRYAYKVWLGPIMIAICALGPLALVIAGISH